MKNNAATQNICFKELNMDYEYEVPIDCEFTLPDYCPPIKKLLRYKVSPKVSSKSVSGGNINIDGVAKINILYLDDLDEIYSFDSGTTFTKNIDSKGATESLIIKADVSADRVMCKITSERKFQIKGVCQLKVKVYNVKRKECLKAEVKTSEMSLNQGILFGDRTIIIEDEISLSDSFPPISRIISNDAAVVPDECKIMNNKVMVKGNFVATVTYLCEQNKPHSFEQKIPYSQVCDIDGIDDSYDCQTTESLVFVEYKCRNSGIDDNRTVSVTAKLTIGIEATSSSVCTVIKDAYSLSSEILPTYETITTANKVGRITDRFSVKKSLEFSEGTVSSVFDLKTHTKVTGVNINDHVLTLTGILHVELLLMNISGMPEFYEKNIDFEYRCNIETDGNIECAPNISANNVNYLITSDSVIDITADLSVWVTLNKIGTETILSDISYKEDSVKRDECSVILAFIEEPCDLWEVGKKYKSSICDILRINGIDDSVDKYEGTLLIPIK